MLKFVGAVAAQLLGKGLATESGLKIYPKRIETESLVYYVNADGVPSKLMPPAAWATPPKKVWKAILTSGINPDCLALAAASVGQLVRHVRPRSRRDPSTFTELAPRRESSRHRDLVWKAVPTMTKETASVWRNRRRPELDKAKRWLWSLLKKNGFTPRFDADEAIELGTQSRPDLSAVITGKTLHVNKHDAGYSRKAPHYSLKRGRHRATSQAAASI